MPSTLCTPATSTPSISNENRLERLKSPWVLVVLLCLSRPKVTGSDSSTCPVPSVTLRSLQSGQEIPAGPPLSAPGSPGPHPRPCCFAYREARRAGPPAARLALLGLARHLADAEDDELGRLHGSDADLADHLPRVDDFGRVGLGIALDEERFLRGLAHQRAGVVDAEEEGRDVARHSLPERLVVRLEHHPLRADLDRLLDHQEQAADVDVAPRRIAGDRPGPPDADAAVAHVPDAVDPARVHEVLLGARDAVLQAQRSADDLVRGSLVHAALAVAASVDAGHVARGRDEDVALLGVVYLDPGEVVRRVLRVARLGHLCDAILAQLLSRVEDREAVLVVLAVRDDRVLDRRVRLSWRADERDLRDVVEHVQAGAPAGALVPADEQRRAGAGRGGRSGSGCRGGGLARLGGLLRFGFLLLGVLRRLLGGDGLGRHVADERLGAAVVEEAVHGVGKQRGVLEVAEGPGVLRPVRDQHRLVRRADRRLADERAGRSPDCLDGLRSAVDLLDIDARGQIRRRHGLLSLPFGGWSP